MTPAPGTAVERGSALLEVMVLGFVAALVVLQGLVTMGRYQAAGELVSETAQAAALHAARTGRAGAAHRYVAERVPAADFSIHLDDTEARVVITLQVSLVGPAAGPLRGAVTGRAVARVSPYRSHAHG